MLVFVTSLRVETDKKISENKTNYNQRLVQCLLYNI